jgi:hypothetical protein
MHHVHNVAFNFTNRKVGSKIDTAIYNVGLGSIYRLHEQWVDESVEVVKYFEITPYRPSTRKG